MRFLSSLAGLVLALLAIWFAVANRHVVDLTLDPFPLSFRLPLYLPVLVAAFGGLVVGGIVSWNAAAPRRARLRRAERERSRLEREVAQAGAAARRKDEAGLPSVSRQETPGGRI